MQVRRSVCFSVRFMLTLPWPVTGAAVRTVIGSVAVQTHAARQLHNATLTLRSVAGHMGGRARHMTDVFTCYSRVPHSSLRSDPRLLITSASDLNWTCWLVFFRCPTAWMLVLKNNRRFSLIALMIHAPVGLEPSAVKTTIWTIERDRHVHMLFSTVSLSLVSCLWCLAALWSRVCLCAQSGVCVCVCVCVCEVNPLKPHSS